MLRLAFVTGTEPGKWFARYRDTTEHGLEETPSDDPLALLIDGSADLAILRLPDPRIGAPGERFHQVQLYAEKPGVAVPKDSVYAEVGESVRPAELADEHVNYRFVQGGGAGEQSGGSIDELRAALQVVAANVGVAFAPAPLLKVLSKKQVVVLELLDGRPEDAGSGEARQTREGLETRIALAWEVEKDSEAIQDFVGVAKGRTRNSSRGAGSSGRAESSRARTSRGREPSKGAQAHGSAPNRDGKNRKAKSKNSGQRKGSRPNHPKKGVRKNWK